VRHRGLKNLLKSPIKVNKNMNIGTTERRSGRKEITCIKRGGNHFSKVVRIGRGVNHISDERSGEEN